MSLIPSGRLVLGLIGTARPLFRYRSRTIHRETSMLPRRGKAEYGA